MFMCLVRTTGKGKGHSLTHNLRHKGGPEVHLYPLLTSALDGGGVVNAILRPLYPRERDSVPLVQETEWAPKRVRMVEEEKKFHVSTGVKPGTVQPEASRCTD
jgi:hypothetical protein